ncbi:hypothetical protein [Streptomyces sp. NBC_01304]|uniref:hypothetical protein n=1 Tax=Streptomyces sp. NBC_01304 TaxID=2903818 RepID=UPI002E150B08|nr:hypothetical protein OG430_44710 [Streptomyces sp. NBC_01304]
MRGCISNDFTLAQGRLLGLAGPVKAVRSPGTPSGLYRDPLGLRVAAEPAGGITSVTGSQSTASGPRVDAGGWWTVPAPTVTVKNPSASRPFMVSGTWSLSWSATVPKTQGEIRMHADPALYPFTRPALVSRWRPGSIGVPTVWAGAMCWPVTEWLNGGETLRLYLNPQVCNDLYVPLGLDYCRVVFNGIATAPDDTSKRDKRIGEAITGAAGATVEAAITGASGATVHDVVENWSKP